MDFTPSATAQSYLARLRSFMQEHVYPIETALLEQQETFSANWHLWQVAEEIPRLKALAKEAGLWNLFMPEMSGLKHVEYAQLAEEMGRSLIASEIFNCNAPDTGNMELLWKYGSEAQNAAWLEPLMRGEIRSAFCMTEPDVASSDATNLQASIRKEGDSVILNGRKWWSTGIGHPQCKVLIFLGLSDPEADPHSRHSMVLVPMDTPGVKVERMLSVFGTYDPPYGHGEVSFTDVCLPLNHVIGGLGKGFAIAQGRLGPGRVHHCMRAIGMAERALEMMVARAADREAFGRPLFKLGGNGDILANARMKIDMARLLVLQTAWLLDTVGIRGAISQVSQIKVVAPNVACEVIDQAMQMFGGMGLSADTPLAAMYAHARVLRLADGPDEVHRAVVAKRELKRLLGAS